METVDICYSKNKSGTYVQFKMRIHTNDLSEINEYSKFLMKSIEKDFKSLFEDHGMAFTTESCYIVFDDGGIYLIVCIQGASSGKLDEALRKIGIERRGFLEDKR